MSYILPLDSKSPNNQFRSHLNFNYSLGLPNSLRESLLRADLGEAALVLDGLFSVGYKVGSLITFRTAAARFLNAGIAVSPALIRRALNTPEVFKRGKARRRGRGRPTNIYHMPSVEMLIIRFGGGQWSPSDALHALDLGSLKAYRLALHRAFIQRLPGNYSRAFLAARLGVCKRSTRNYDRLAQIVVMTRFDYSKIEIYFDQWPDDGLPFKPGIVDEAKIWAAKPGQHFLLFQWRDGTERRMPLKLGVIWRYTRAVAAGDLQIFLAAQLTNHYSV